MKVGVPTEIKEDEYRVSLTPAGARELREHGHEVLLQAGAGEGSAIPDDAYAAQGARILPDAAAVFEQSEMVLGVKEPQPVEVEMLRPDHTLFTFLHLAPAPELTTALQASGATCVAIGMEADVFVYDVDIDKLRELDIAFAGRASTVYSSTLAVEEMLPRADLVIGAVLVHGARAPYVIKRDQLGLMRERAVLVDVSIDQGGCFETSRPTTHSDPVYEVDGVTHYCVANMPGAVPVTSTFALTNATLPYVLALADHGVQGAIARDPGLRGGVNVAGGRVTHPAVAEGTGMEYTPVEDVLSVTA